MKIQYQIYLICLFFLIFSRPVLAAEATKSAAQDLLDRVATKVATLTQQLRKVYIGDVKSVGTTSYVVTTTDGDRTVTTNDVTSFYRLRAGSKTEINFGAIKKGDSISAIGTIDPNTFEMTAKQIVAKIRRFNVTGTISSVEKSVISVQETTGPLTKIDLADTTNLKTVNSKGQIIAAKLSNFNQGDLVFVIAYFAGPESDTLSALKALSFTR